MGVISSSGIVGKVKYVSQNFATIISTLNTSFYISSIVKKNQYSFFCELEWRQSKNIKITLCA